MKKLLTLSLLSLSVYSVSDGHPEGAFNTLFVKAAVAFSMALRLVVASDR